MELGCGVFENALLILGYLYKNCNDYKLIGVSDGAPLAEIPPKMAENFIYLRGITYESLPHLGTMCPEVKLGVDILIVDSDHNYFTVKKELQTSLPYLSKRCVIAFHDTNTLEDNDLVGHTFVNMSQVENSTFEFGGYKNGAQYPLGEIVKTLDLPITKAIEEFLDYNPEFKILKKTTDHCGCWLIGRNVEESELYA